MNIYGLVFSLVMVALASARPQAPIYGSIPDYDNTPVILCPNYPYCNDAPYGLPHLQDEINVLRQRALLIEKVGESIPLQQPNQPFVAIVPAARYANYY